MSDNQEPAELSAQKRALFAIRDLKARLEAIERARTEPIAIVGMGCRLPGASNVDEYWELLRNGVDAIRPVPRDRWDVDALYDPDPEAPGKTYAREGGFIDQIDKFDASFFGIPPREVTSMDPQQRLLLEVSWEALEDAGIPPAGLGGSNTGVFVGLGTTDYTEFTIHNPDSTRIDAYVGTGAAPCVAAGRISFVLGLHGPAMTVDTACSSSLVAIDLAVQQLRNGKCRMALAGGVNAILSARSTVYLSKIRALSLTGRCRSFDAAADGYARGEGCGMLVLKRLSDAERDGDRVLAVIRGAATNHDGRSSGLTVPSGAAQESVIRQALADGGLEPGQVDYIEAHGTGTPLGDPIEIRALGAVFGRERPNRLIVGTVKTNIGHLEAASGVAGIIKIVLAMRHGVIPRMLHFSQPSPHIPWDDLFVTMASEPTAWPDATRLPVAGISGYGFSGTNAHVIIEAAPAAVAATGAAGETVQAERPQHLLTLSASTTAAVAQLAGRYEQVCASDTASAADVAFSANTGRSHFDHRVAIVGDGTARFASALRAVANDEDHPLVIRGRVDGERSKIGFLFTGQGSQYVGMGRELYETDATFRKTLQECDEVLRPLLDRSILSVLHGATPADAAAIDQTAYTQPALFSVEYALAVLWRSWGIEPAFVMGHSLGEYVAACFAGLFSLEDGLRLIAARARLMQSMPAGGRMAAVFAPETVVAAAIAGKEAVLSIAAINGPEHVVISGAGDALSSVLSTLSATGVKSQELVVSHAFHSPLMDPILDEFEGAAARVTWLSPRVRVVSNLTGDIASSSELAQPAYWRRHLRAPVRFSASVNALVANGCNWLLEVGPHPTLLGMAGRFLAPGKMLSLPSLRKGQSDTTQMLRTLGTMYVHGADVDFRGLDLNRARRRVSLPHYAFQRTRHWADVSAPRSVAPAASNEQQSHPLLGSRLRSPLLHAHVFELRMPAAALRFVDDHVVYGTAVFPATGFIEMAAAGARAVFGTSSVTVEDFAVEEALALPDGSAFVVQAAFAPIDGGGSSFQIFSRDAASADPDAAWTRHAAGTVRARAVAAEAARESLADIRKRCDRPVDAAQLYERLEQHGISYGPTFRGMKELWRGVDEAVGLLQLPPQLVEESAEYGIHPAFLDAALQVLGASVAGDDDGADVFLPVGFSRIAYHGAAPEHLWSHARLFRDASNPETLRSDLKWFDDDGRVVWEATGVTMKRASRQALQRAGDRKIDEWLYEVDWQPAEPVATASATANGAWLILANGNGLAERLAAEIRSRGGSPVLVRAGEAFALTGGDYTIDPTRFDHFEQLLKDVGSRSPVAGAVHLWSLDVPGESPDVDDLERAVRAACGSALLLVQAFAAVPAEAPRLAFVTRGAVAVGLAPWPVQMAQAAVWGLARTVAVEQPQWRSGTIDIDPAAALDDAGRLADEVVGLESENQIAWRTGSRFVARLVRKRRNQPGERRLAVPAGDGFQLTTSARGVIDNLCFEPRPRPLPGTGQVEVRVHAGGLNFRDVLNALGMYPGDPGPMGGESAGRVTAVGAGVSDLRVGDDVMCMAGGSFGRYVITPRDAVVRLPAGLTYEQGASIPITFLTAHYGLHHLAHIKKGDRVLVHAAAGGVGQAAAQIALRAGAEVYGTAGSVEKREYVRALGVSHVFSSRTADFASELMTITGGHGVDIVLNSLTGAFIPESLKVIKPGGYFLEIGKAEIWSPDAVAAVNPKVSYLPFDLGDVLQREPATVAAMFADIVDGLASGSLRPLPIRIFDVRDAQSAFRYMAQAKHVGKLVLSQRDLIAEETGSACDASGTYLITGGAGGLGVKVAEWLVGRNARHLVLTGRSTPSADAARAIDTLRAAGATVAFARADIAVESDVRRILDDIAATSYPLRGVVHAAGVLDDGLLSQMSWPRFQTVMAPKVRGGWLLHRLTQRDRLDFFVLFSSTSAVLGAPGQSNYAAANAFLDGLAQHRRAQGAPALSVNWGAWSDVGMAARLQGRDQSRIADRGIGSITPEQGVRTLGLLLNQPDANVTVLPVRWQKFFDAYSAAVPAMLRVVAKDGVRLKERSRPDAAGDSLKTQLAAVPEAERETMLRAFVRSQVAKVLGLESGDTLDLQVPFTSLGLDSLMAVELRNAIGVAMSQTLPASLVFDYPSMERLADFMASQLLPRTPDTAAPTVDAEATQWEKMSEQLEDLSDDQMAALLASQLASLGGNEGEK